MKKALVLVLMLTLVASAIATEYPIGYKDKYCKEEWVKHGYHWEWEEVCNTLDRETSVEVPEVDLKPLEDKVAVLESKEDKSGIHRRTVWNILIDEYLPMLKDIFALKSDFDTYKEDTDEKIQSLTERVWACEDRDGITEGYR